MTTEGTARIPVLGVSIAPLGVPGLVAAALTAASNGPAATLFYANAHTLALARRDPPFRQALSRADIVFCDGFGARLAAGLLGQPLPPRATPPDWIAALAAGAARDGVPIFLLGGAPGVAALAAAALRSAHPELEIAGQHHGYFERHGDAQKRVLELIRNSGARLLLVGLGQPRQELWIDAQREHLPPAVLAVGALFEWLGGSDRRAPSWASDHGLEWAFRLARHPVRHFNRYLVGLPTLALAIAAERWRQQFPVVLAGPSRVAFVFGPTDGGHSGAYRHLADLLAALSRDRRVEMQVFVLKRDRKLLPPGGFQIHTVSNLFASAPASILWHRLVLPWRARLAGARVLHLPYANRRLAVPSHPPVLATVHDLAERTLPGRYPGLRARHAALIRSALARAPRVVAVSEETRRQVLASGVDPERVSVIANGLRGLPVVTIDEARRRLTELGIASEYDLLYVSRLEHPGKNHVRLLDALALLRGAGRTPRLALVGAPWNGASTIIDRSHRLGLDRQVTRLGFVTDDVLAATYTCARALIFPSLVEGFGLPVLEALGLGLPVACSDRPPMSEVFAGAVLTFDPEDPRAIADAITRILDDEALRKQQIERGLRLASTLTWDLAARQTVELYGELAGKSIPV